MKILLATNWLLPHLGGVSNYMAIVKKKLEEMGHEVDLFGKNDTNSFYMLTTGEQLNRFDHLHPMLEAKNKSLYEPLFKHGLDTIFHIETERFALELTLAYLGLHKYDLIYSQDIIATYALSRVKPPKTPLVGSVHGDIVQEVSFIRPQEELEKQNGLLLKYYSFLEQLGVKFADQTIVSCNYMKNSLVSKHAVAPEHIRVVPLGFDISNFYENMQHSVPFSTPNGKKVILFAARLTRLKGLDILIHALSLLSNVRNDWECWIAGDGDATEEMQQLASHLSLNHQIRFLGKHDDIPALLNKASIFLLPSLHETLPYSVMEAQLAGKAVIATNVGGVPELIQDGITGLLAPAGNSELLFNHLNTLLSHDHLLNELGHNAKQHALQKYSADMLVHNLTGVFNEVLHVQ
ncbi:glycosyltransferase family 4 protein [Paenibacillus sp. FSL R10-2782]|uniref:glycosyltransferase family 4 protein n=1 Tax=Paenibacillus sp. FSL R10-2782 TaxID=2954661 RepID=UPI0031586A8E